MVISGPRRSAPVAARSRALGIAVINGTGMTGAALESLLMGWMKDVTGSFNAGIFMVAGFARCYRSGVYSDEDRGETDGGMPEPR